MTRRHRRRWRRVPVRHRRRDEYGSVPCLLLALAAAIALSSAGALIYRAVT